MNAVLAENVKSIREFKHWTQQHTADVAGVLLRTLQRVEKGDGASLETLGALANAFDVSINFLQLDRAKLIEEAKRTTEELQKTHDLIPVSPVTCAAHLEIVGDCHASLIQCVASDDDRRDAFAHFESEIHDFVNVCDDLSAVDRRAWAKTAYEQVQELNRLGLVVCIGKAPRKVHGFGEPVMFDTLYVVAWPQGDEKQLIAVER